MIQTLKAAVRRWRDRRRERAAHELEKEHYGLQTKRDYDRKHEYKRPSGPGGPGGGGT